MTASAASGGLLSRGIFNSTLPIRACKSDRSKGALKMSFTAFFQDRWIAFLKENFHSPEQIACAFGVTAVTAHNWLNGSTAPRGHCVAMAFRDFPAEAAKLTGENDEPARKNSRSTDLDKRAGRVAGGARHGKGVAA